MQPIDPSSSNARASAFCDLHQAERTFVMPCAWDAFSAQLFERAGFQCVGTTSGGVNWVKGRKDYIYTCLLYTSPSPRDGLLSRMPSSA